LQRYFKALYERQFDTSSFLDIETFDLRELSVVRSISGDELGDDGEWLSRIYLATTSTAVEIRGSSGISVDSATPTIARGTIARMSGVDSAQAVGFPNIHLIARWTARLGRLSVAVASSKLSSNVSWFDHTIFWHGNEVEGRIHSTTHVFHVNIEGEFPVEQSEHAIPVYKYSNDIVIIM